MSKGIFVAFDGVGRHFAYAVHWEDVLPADAPVSAEERMREEREQRRAIDGYEAEARQRGGELRLLSPDEYADIVLKRDLPARSPVPSIPASERY